MSKSQQIFFGIMAILLGIGGIFLGWYSYDPKGGALAKNSNFRVWVGSIIGIIGGLILLIEAFFE